MPQMNAHLSTIGDGLRELKAIEQRREDVENRQQYMRDMVFWVHAFLEKRYPVLEAPQKLFWSMWLRNRLQLDNISAQSFNALPDKKAALEIVSSLDEKIGLTLNDIPEEDHDQLFNAAGLAFSVPVLQRLSLMAQLRGTMQSSGALRMNKLKAQWGTAIATGFLAAVLFAAIAGKGVSFFGLLVGMTFLAGYPVQYLFSDKVLDMFFKPQRWNESLALANQCDVAITPRSIAPEIDGLIEAVECQLPLVSQEKAVNPSDYTQRYNDALAEYNRVSARFGLGV